MNFEQVETAVKKLSKEIKPDSFVYDFLLAYGTPKAIITMLKNGSRNLSKKDNEVICKKKVYFTSVEEEPEVEFERILSDKKSYKNDPRFILVTDYEELFALDTKLNEKISFEVKDIHKKFDFFLPLAGIEKKEFQHENPVDVKAAEKLAKLFDLIKADNPLNDEKSLHSLNVFLTRLLFCYFAEDTGIFLKSIFTKSIASHTQVDGSDLSAYLTKLFSVMNIEKRSKDLPDYISSFPYVNGGLFAEEHPIPKFSKKSRKVLLDVGDLDWAEINPDIFGSMIQAVVHPDQRAGLGMHYTSVSNIMKVIEPLFLGGLYEELEKSKKSTTKLKKLLKRISGIKIFDPACGSGNFLIIAYKELRKLEMEIYKHMPGEMKLSYIPLSNFYGIEIDDFAHEVAILSLWLAQHQMDIQFFEEFGTVKASLPLKNGGNIVCGNASEVLWDQVCPCGGGGEVYILGNPPYAGARKQTTDQKRDLKEVLGKFKNSKNLDYISIFFWKLSEYVLKFDVRGAFVSTNSICQGEQVGMLWPHILDSGVEIDFAYTPFKWKNNAKSNAGVTCIIVGLRKRTDQDKFLFSEAGHVSKAKNINPYLIDFKDIVVHKRTKPLSELPLMPKGNMPYDGGNLILTTSEKDQVLREFPNAKKFIKKLMGAKEYIQNIGRWCLWIRDDELKEAMKISFIKNRVEKVKKMRLSSTDKAANKLAERPHQFRETNETKTSSLIIPSASSERRKYIPIGFVDSSTIVTNLAFVIYEADAYMFSVLSSYMHMVWVRAVSGQLETRIRYSSALSYNTFPCPPLSVSQQDELRQKAFEIIAIREKYQNKKIADIYDPEKMPEDLKTAHEDLDNVFESFCKKDGFENDGERLKFLFKEYERGISD